MSNVDAKILIETLGRIHDWEHSEITGLLDPYWSSIDKELIFEFAYLNIKVDEDAYYMQVGTKPLKWYWYFLILFLSVFYLYKFGGHLILKILNRNMAKASNDEHL
jgi:hypothetical protein